MFEKETEPRVPPVIGVILIPAVTLTLVKLTLFDISGKVVETLLRNENVNYLYFFQNGNNWGGDPDASPEQDGLRNAGDIIDTASNSEPDNDVGASTETPVNVIAAMSDGNEEVLTSTTVEA